MALSLLDDDGAPIYRERAWEMSDPENRKVRIDHMELIALMGDGNTVTNVNGDATVYTPVIRVTDTVGEYTDVSGVTFELFSSSSTLVNEPIVWLQVSTDAGRTWSYEKQRALGQIGEYDARARWRRLGVGRNRAFRIGTTMQQRVHWVGAPAKGEAYSA
jgi:hypothetical protein